MSSTYGAYQDSLLGHVANQTTHHTTNHSKLEDIKTKLDSVITNTGDLELNTDTLEAKIQTTNDTLTDGTQKTLLIGSNDILGNTPHRHLTVDANGRLLTIPTMTSTNNAIGTTNTKLNAGLPSALSTAGNLKVSIEEGGGDASATNQSTMISSLSTIQGDTTSIDGKITQGEADVAGGGNGLQQILCYGKDQSGNLDPLNVDNNGHLKITLNDIESGITSSIKTTNDNITKGADLTLTEAQQNLVYGVDAFNTSQLEPIRISSDKVMVESFIASVASGITNSMPVKDMVSWEAIATLDSALVVPNAGNNDSSIVSNNKQTDNYIVQIQCDDITYTDFNAEVLESIDASNFKSTSQITQPVIPSFFIMEKINNLSPNWKVRINNTGASTKNFTIKYVKA